MIMLRLFLLPFRVLRDIARMFIVYLPGGTGNAVRRIYYSRRLKSCGKNVIIDTGVLIDGCEFITIGDNVHIDKYCILQAGRGVPGRVRRKINPSFQGDEGELIIGSNVHIVQFCLVMAYGGVRIGNSCTLSAGSKVYSVSNLPHNPDRPGEVVSIMPYQESDSISSPVVLEDNVWTGIGTVVMPGVTIGKNSFTRTNSVVLHSAPENSVLDGMPARRIKPRFSK